METVYLGVVFLKPMETQRFFSWFSWSSHKSWWVVQIVGFWEAFEVPMVETYDGKSRRFKQNGSPGKRSLLERISLGRVAPLKIPPKWLLTSKTNSQSKAQSVFSLKVISCLGACMIMTIRVETKLQEPRQDTKTPLHKHPPTPTANKQKTDCFQNLEEQTELPKTLRKQTLAPRQIGSIYVHGCCCLRLQSSVGLIGVVWTIWKGFFPMIWE